MPTENLDDFSVPWAQSLINDPSWQPAPTFSRVLKPPPNTENYFLASTLWNADCVRAVQSFHTASSNPPSLIGSETRMLFSLGSGLDGHNGHSAGGFIGVLIDEVSAQWVAMLFGRAIATGALSVQYKKMLPTPNVVLCRSWIEKEPEGRKIWVQSSIEDGSAGVYATGETLFIREKPKL